MVAQCVMSAWGKAVAEAKKKEKNPEAALKLAKRLYKKARDKTKAVMKTKPMKAAAMKTTAMKASKAMKSMKAVKAGK